jgi:hypothetical protein
MSTWRSNQLSYAPPFKQRHAPGGTRTPSLLVRSQTLYPIELRAHTTKSHAHDRTRTCTPSPALVPQTSLSTNFSTWAEYMLEEGLEPSRGHPHRILNPARLPIPPPELYSFVHHDGAEGNRTPDLLNAIQALSQLSYGPLTRPAKPGPLGRLTPIFQTTLQRG